MDTPRRSLLLVFAGLALATLVTVAAAMHGPRLPPPTDLSTALARAYDEVQAAKLKLCPPGQVDRTVLDANGVGERNAPSFYPRQIARVGAVTFKALGRTAVLVQYRGESLGRFAVISLPGSMKDVSQDSDTIQLGPDHYTSFLRPGPKGLPLHGVGGVLAGRLVYVVGPQKEIELAQLFQMIPLP